MTHSHQFVLPLSLRRRAAYKALGTVLDYDKLMRAMWMLEERAPNADRLTFLGLISVISQVFNIDNQIVSKIMLDTNRYLAEDEAHLPPDPLAEMNRFLNKTQEPAPIDRGTYTYSSVWNDHNIAEFCQHLANTASSQNQKHFILAHSSHMIDSEIIATFANRLQQQGCIVYRAGNLPYSIYNFIVASSAIGNGIYLVANQGKELQIQVKVALAGDLQRFSTDGVLMPPQSDITHFTPMESPLGFPVYASDYLAKIFDNISPLRPFFVAIISPSQLVLEFATELFTEFGCKVRVLNPRENANNIPVDKRDPVNAQLMDLAHFIVLKKADVGFYFNHDCSSLRVVNKQGKVLSHFDVSLLLHKAKQSAVPQHLSLIDSKWQPLMSNLSTEDKKHLVLGDEPEFLPSIAKDRQLSFTANDQGHFHFYDRWHGLNDAFYSASRVLETLSTFNNDDV